MTLAFLFLCLSTTHGLRPALPFALMAVGQEQAAPVATIRQFDVRGYIDELDRVASGVSKLPENPGQIVEMESSLPRAWVVHGGGQTFTVSTDWLTATLASMESTPKLRASLQKDVLARLAALRSEAESFEKPNGEPDAAAARAKVTEILKGREFESVSPPGWFQKLTQRIGSWIGRVLRRIFRPIFRFSRSREILFWGVVALLFGLLAFLVVRLLMRTARTSKLVLDSPVPTGKTWRDWANEALDAAARRDYRDAVHRGYWAGIFRLKELGALRLERDRTPREYLRMVEESAEKTHEQLPGQEGRPAGGLPERRAALATLTRRLEITWYGYQVATQDDFRATIENLEALGCRFPSTLPIAES